jgi:hypothetical protein
MDSNFNSNLVIRQLLHSIFVQLREVSFEDIYLRYTIYIFFYLPSLFLFSNSTFNLGLDPTCNNYYLIIINNIIYLMHKHRNSNMMHFLLS